MGYNLGDPKTQFEGTKLPLLLSNAATYVKI